MTTAILLLLGLVLTMLTGLALADAAIRESKRRITDDVPEIDESLARLRYDSEDLEALHMNFDRKGVPRHEDEMTLSAWGRAIRFAQSSEKQAGPIAPSDVEEFIRDNKFVTSIAKPKERDGVHSVSIHDLRQWMAGHVRVPVDVLETILEVVRGKLNEAYQNAMPVCCGQPGQECCGDPVAEWNPSDIELMDSLGPVEKTISAMLTASKERTESIEASQEGV